MSERLQGYARLGMLGLLGSAASGWAQAAPTATAPTATVLTPVSTVNGLGYELPTGTFRYGGTASELFQFGYYPGQGTTYQTNLSGNVAYASRSTVHPFTAVYSGGVEFANQTGYGTTFYQGLSLTQEYVTRQWTFSLSDAVSYLPQSPTVGLSGVPGTGDLGLSPVAGNYGPNQSVLTYNSNRVTNTVSGLVSRHLTGRTSISGDASYSLLHFFSDASLDSRQISADVVLTHELSARSSVGLAANYSIFNYDVSQDATFETKALTVQGRRQLTRSLAAAASVGPQWINASSGLGIPARLTVTASASLTYEKRFGTAALFFSRGTNGGAGVLPGSISTSVGGSFSRSLGRDWSAALNGGYARTSGLGTGATPDLAALGLPNYGSFDSTFGGAQVNRRLTGSLSAFASYTAASQGFANFGQPGTLTRGALNGVVQTVAVGVSFYPRSFIPGQF